MRTGDMRSNYTESVSSLKNTDTSFRQVSTSMKHRPKGYPSNYLQPPDIYSVVCASQLIEV